MGAKEDLDTVRATRRRLTALSARLEEAGSWRRHMDMTAVLDSLTALEAAWEEHLTEAQHFDDLRVLRTLVRLGRRRSTSELAHEIGTTSATVGSSLERLAADGYVFGGPDRWEATGTGARVLRGQPDDAS